jgi:DNA-binding MarR family transcriptional regulator
MDETLARLSRFMKLQSIFKKYGLTATQMFIMRYLSHEAPAKSSDIAKFAGLSPGAITQVCDELVRMGVVGRSRSDTDRRVVYVDLTSEGHAKVQSMLEDRAVRVGNILDKLGYEDADTLLRLLGKLADIVEAEEIAEEGEEK